VRKASVKKNAVTDDSVLQASPRRYRTFRIVMAARYPRFACCSLSPSCHVTVHASALARSGGFSRRIDLVDFGASGNRARECRTALASRVRDANEAARSAAFRTPQHRGNASTSIRGRHRHAPGTWAISHHFFVISADLARLFITSGRRHS